LSTFVIASILSFTVLWPAFAAEPHAIYLQQASQSPDGQLEIVIEETGGDTGQAIGIARIQNRQTGKAAGSFEFFCFGVHPDTVSVKTLRRADSRCFAVWWQRTRGYTSFQLFILSQGQWISILLPDYIAPIRKLAGVKKLHTKGHEIPLKWLTGNRLLIEVGNSFLEKDFEVTLQISDATRTQKPKARIQKIEQFSENQ
jgi:hypothetical protein